METNPKCSGKNTGEGGVFVYKDKLQICSKLSEKPDMQYKIGKCKHFNNKVNSLSGSIHNYPKEVAKKSRHPQRHLQNGLQRNLSWMINHNLLSNILLTRL